MLRRPDWGAPWAGGLNVRVPDRRECQLLALSRLRLDPFAGRRTPRARHSHRRSRRQGPNSPASQ